MLIDLFSIVIKYMSRAVKEEMRALGKDTKHMIFVDDMMTWEEEATEVQIQLNAWNKQMKLRGLRISVADTTRN